MSDQINRYWRAVASVFSGMLLAQLIPIVGSLLIVRLYSPENYGNFAAWMAIVAILGVILTLRLEQALGLEDPEERDETLYAIALITLISGIFALPGLYIVGFFTQNIFDNALRNILLIVLAGVLTAFAQTWQNRAAIGGLVRTLSSLRIVQAAVITVAQIIIAYWNNSASGLIAGQLIGLLTSVCLGLFLIPCFNHRPRTVRGHTHLIIHTVKKFKRFPVFALPADMINTIAGQLPVLMLKNRFGDEITGYYALTMRIMGAPIALLANAIRDVFKQAASDQFRRNGSCRLIYIRTLKVLGVGSIIFMVMTYLSAKPIFTWVFGTSWEMSGTIAIWLAPLFAFRFASSPLSYTLYIAQKQHIDLIWQVSLLIFTYIILTTFATYDKTIIYYSLMYAVMYIIYILISYQASSSLSRSLKKN